MEKEAHIEIAHIRVPQTIALEEWARAYLEGNNLEVLFPDVRSSTRC